MLGRGYRLRLLVGLAVLGLLGGCASSATLSPPPATPAAAAAPSVAVAGAVVQSGASGAIWSPTGTQVAYVWSFDEGTGDLRVVDIASGTDRTLVTGLQVNGTGLLGWSPAGDRVLFAGLDQKGSSLWSINADGTDRKVLVDGAESGEWQPVPIP